MSRAQGPGFAPIAWLEDVSVGSWVASTQLDEHGRVGALVPPSFDSYVAVRPAGAAVNPDRAMREHLVRKLCDHGVDVDWCTFAISEVYGWDGVTTRGTANLLFERPVHDEKDIEDLHRLLSDRVSPPPAPPRSSTPTLLETRLRSYMLYRGPLEDAGAAARAGAPTEVPDLWWPDGRTWFVATDTDLDGVIVAGPRALTTSLACSGFRVESVTPRTFLG